MAPMLVFVLCTVTCFNGTPSTCRSPWFSTSAVTWLGIPPPEGLIGVAGRSIAVVVHRSSTVLCSVFIGMPCMPIFQLDLNW